MFVVTQELTTREATSRDRKASQSHLTCPRFILIAALRPHLEDLPVGVQDVDGDLNVLLDALPSSLKVPSLQCQVQVVPDVTCGTGGHIKAQTSRQSLT